MCASPAGGLRSGRAASGHLRSFQATSSSNPEAGASYVRMCQNRRARRAQKSAIGKGSSERRAETQLRFTGSGERTKPPIGCTAEATAQQAVSDRNL